MSESAARLLSVEEFSHQTMRSPREIIKSLETGSLAGSRIEDEWFVNASQAEASTQGCRSEADSLMRAWAALHWREVLAHIYQRRESVFKARTVELGVSIDNIRLEAERARARSLNFDFLIAIAALFGMIAAFDLLTAPSYEFEEPLAEGGSSSMLMLAAAFLVVAVADFVNRRMARRRARTILQARPGGGAYDAQACTEGEPNVVVSGGYSPFVGAGHEVAGWSFTMNLAEPQDPAHPVREASPQDLYREAEQALRALGMPNLALRDELYVDGRDVRDVELLMPLGPYHAPVETLSERRMDDFIGRNDDRTRHYKAIRCVLWDSQVVLSTFLRYVVVKNVLFVEARSFLLPPLSEDFLALKNMPLVPSFSEHVREFALSLCRATVIWAMVLGRAADFIQGGFLNTRERWLRRSTKEVLANQRYSYGWARSLRETWAGENFERYFQRVDQDFCKKVVQESLLDSLLKSLSQRNICTDSLKNATTTIHNEGVIVNGGSLQAENLTAGRSASSTFQRAPRPQ
jgi:hypothetical protein